MKLIFHPNQFNNNKLIPHTHKLVERARKGEIYLLLESLATCEDRKHTWHLNGIEVQPTHFIQGIESESILVLNWICTCYQMTKDLQNTTLQWSQMNGMLCLLTYINAMLCNPNFMDYVINIPRNEDWFEEFLDLVHIIYDEVDQEYGQINRVIDIIEEKNLNFPLNLPMRFIHESCKDFLVSMIQRDIDMIVLHCTLLYREAQMAENINKWIRNVKPQKEVHVLMGVGHLTPFVDEEVVRSMLETNEEANFFIHYHNTICANHKRLLHHLDYPHEIHYCLEKDRKK